MHTPRLLALMVGLLSAPTSLSAQQLLTVPLDSGALVRMRLADSQLVQGRLVQRLAPTSSDIFFCRYPANPCVTSTDDGLRSLRMANLRGLEVASGTRWARGALIGGIIGGVLNFVGTEFVNAFCEDSRCVHNAFGMAAVGALAGIGWGALFGSTHVVWRPAP